MLKSAGIVIYRQRAGALEILLVHSNGREDLEAWSIPKGEYQPETERPIRAAVREVREELGLDVPEDQLQELGESVYRSKRKRVTAFGWQLPAGEIHLEVDPFEISEVEFFPLDLARVKIHEAQVVFLDRLLTMLES